MPKLIISGQSALGAVWSLLACVACSQGDDIHPSSATNDPSSATDDLARQDTAAESELTPFARASDPNHPSAVHRSKLTFERRRQLNLAGNDLLADLATRAPAPGTQPAVPAADEQAALHEAPERANAAAELWAKFLENVDETPEGTFVVDGDISIGDEQELLSYFERLYAKHIDKGVILLSSVWPRGCSGTCAPRLDVCWTGGNATDAERRRVADLVLRSFGSMTEVALSFVNVGNNINLCTTTPPAGGWDIRIFQDSSITRGCSRIGTTSLSLGVNCGAGASNAGASMVLPTPSTSNATADWVDYTAVHEFGHALSMLHEQNHSLSTCTNSVGNTPGQQDRGAYDPFAIMNYCQQDNINLEHPTNAWNDPRFKEVSIGDIQTAQFLYPTSIPTRQGVFRYRSWSNINVRLTFEGQNTQVSSTRTAQIAQSFAFSPVGANYAASAVALNGSRLRCPDRSRAPGVWSNPAVTPPTGFTNIDPVIVDCYDPAGLAHVAMKTLRL